MKDLQVFELLKKHQQTVGFAESCTGGMLSSAFTEVEGISAVFKGSVIAYCDEVKTKLLKVDATHLKKQGPYNQETAKQMAEGLKKQIQSDWSVATTGIASPIPGQEQNTGLVYFAVVGPKNFIETSQKYFNGTRDQVISQAVLESMTLLKKSMEGNS